MNSPLIFVVCLAVVSTAIPTAVYAADSLPPSMSGRWFGSGQTGQQRNFEVAIVIEKQSPDGSVEGKLTRWGNGCGAKDEPFKGTFDGAVLKFKSMSRANVNSRLPNGVCGEDEYVLKLNADGKSALPARRSDLISVLQTAPQSLRQLA